ncbi:hypothetical protein CTI12_AA496700 [Artemisia annua]|uniref:DUF4057 domain-containing protein n=1 Tax=Artemisia annua TaxID=35608 RepID=A0A2U1L3W4_ARTAN|nr:hypothetical protein CTI12_AA496700 [Artemisia annua]
MRIPARKYAARRYKMLPTYETIVTTYILLYELTHVNLLSNLSYRCYVNQGSAISRCNNIEVDKAAFIDIPGASMELGLIILSNESNWEHMDFLTLLLLSWVHRAVVYSDYYLFHTSESSFLYKLQGNECLHGKPCYDANVPFKYKMVEPHRHNSMTRRVKRLRESVTFCLVKKKPVSPKKSISEAKQRELSGTLDSDSETRLKKQISDAKNRELSGHNIFSPPLEIQTRPLVARALAFRENITVIGEPPPNNNEYGNIDKDYGPAAQSRIKWEINTCNRFYCERFTPNSKNKHPIKNKRSISTTPSSISISSTTIFNKHTHITYTILSRLIAQR